MLTPTESSSMIQVNEEGVIPKHFESFVVMSIHIAHEKV